MHQNAHQPGSQLLSCALCEALGTVVPDWGTAPLDHGLPPHTCRCSGAYLSPLSSVEPSPYPTVVGPTGVHRYTPLDAVAYAHGFRLPQLTKQLPMLLKA